MVGTGSAVEGCPWHSQEPLNHNGALQTWWRTPWVIPLGGTNLQTNGHVGWLEGVSAGVNCSNRVFPFPSLAYLSPFHPDLPTILPPHSAHLADLPMLAGLLFITTTYRVLFTACGSSLEVCSYACFQISIHNAVKHIGPLKPLVPAVVNLHRSGPCHIGMQWRSYPVAVLLLAEKGVNAISHKGARTAAPTTLKKVKSCLKALNPGPADLDSRRLMGQGCTTVSNKSILFHIISVKYLLHFTMHWSVCSLKWKANGICYKQATGHNIQRSKFPPCLLGYAFPDGTTSQQSWNLYYKEHITNIHHLCLQGKLRSFVHMHKGNVKHHYENVTEDIINPHQLPEKHVSAKAVSSILLYCLCN